MSGRLASPSPRFLLPCRHLNPYRRSSLPSVSAALALFDSTRLPSGTLAYSATAAPRPEDGDTTAIGGIGVSTRGQRKPDDQNIFVDDLQATLEAHRAANQAKLIHKVKVNSGTGLGFRKVELPVYQNSSSRGAPSQIIEGATDLNLGKNAAIISREHSSNHEPTEEELKGVQSRLLSERKRLKVQTHEYKGRYQVVHGQWRRKYMEAWRSLRSATSQDDMPVDSQGRFVIPKVTDPVEITDERPWMSYVESDESDGMLRLNEEIKAFERFMKPTSDEEKSTQAVISLARSVVAEVAPTSVLTMHGSRYTGVANPLSDIDFSVSLPAFQKDPLERGPSNHRPEARRGGTALLRKIEKALVKSPRHELVYFIVARVNLVVAADTNTGLPLQFQTLASFMPAREYSMQYLSEFPGLRPLYVLLRHFLLMRDFTGTREGGVGSYSLLIMIVTAFKHSRQTFAPEDLGLQLLHVLHFWSTADLYTYGYAADPPMTFTKIPPKTSVEERKARLADPILKGIDIIRKPKKEMPFLLCLQDPGNPTNDLGKRIVQIKHIQACFTTARENLFHSLRTWETLIEYNACRKDKPYSFLDPLVGGDYQTFQQRRERLANAHKVGDRLLYSGFKRLPLKGLYSSAAAETDTGFDEQADSTVSDSDGADPPEPSRSSLPTDNQ